MNKIRSVYPIILKEYIPRDLGLLLNVATEAAVDREQHLSIRDLLYLMDLADGQTYCRVANTLTGSWEYLDDHDCWSIDYES
mgnify:CR=1 FL=1